MAGAEHIWKVVSKIPADYNDVVETGTFLGQSTRQFCKSFDCVHTIELDEKLSKFAEEGVLKDGYHNAIFHIGDSAKVIQKIVQEYNLLGRKVLFYLDAHWSGDESVAEYKDGYTGPHTWIGNYTVHRGDDDNPSSVEQNPLEEEIMYIYDHFQSECIIVIDDFDKFGYDGIGLKNKSFTGEDWSHLDINNIINNISDRLTSNFAIEKKWMMLRLKDIEHQTKKAKYNV
jgi:hypothetical protein